MAFLQQQLRERERPWGRPRGSLAERAPEGAAREGGSVREAEGARGKERRRRRGRGQRAKAAAEPLRALWEGPALLGVVDEVAAGPVGADARGVEGTAGLCLVLGVSAEPSEFPGAVGKLALSPILAGAAFLKGTTQLRLVARRDHFGLAAAPLDEAHGPVRPEGDALEAGAGQLGIPGPFPLEGPRRVAPVSSCQWGIHRRLCITGVGSREGGGTGRKGALESRRGPGVRTGALLHGQPQKSLQGEEGGGQSVVAKEQLGVFRDTTKKAPLGQF